MKNYSFLFELEKQLHSPKTRSDKYELNKLLSSDFFEFGSSGRQWSKEEIIERLPLEKEEYQIHPSQYEARELAPNVVLVTYISSKDSNEEYLRSSIWKETTSGLWQMVFHQGTRRA